MLLDSSVTNNGLENFFYSESSCFGNIETAAI